LGKLVLECYFVFRGFGVSIEVIEVGQDQTASLVDLFSGESWRLVKGLVGMFCHHGLTFYFF
jgi:hypothetical protein